MKNVGYLILISLFCMASTEINAQREDVFSNRKFSVAVEPLLLFDAGMGVDVEMRLKETNSWLNLRLTGNRLSRSDADLSNDFMSNYMTMNSAFEEFHSYSGFGVRATYKNYYLRDEFYWGAGIGYNYFDVSYYAETYKPFVEDGMTFYRFYQGKETQYFNKIYPFITTGVRSPSHRKIFVEGYITVGYSYSYYNETKKAYNKNFFSFGHRGVAMSFGGRVGWQF